MDAEILGAQPRASSPAPPTGPRGAESPPSDDAALPARHYLDGMVDRSWGLSTYACRLAAILVLAVAAAGFLAGCGSGSSTTAASSSSSTTPAATSTPAYCSDVNNFKSAVAQLKNTGSAGAIVASITKVASSGQMAISSVKTAFASQVGALKSSLAALSNTAMQLISSSTRASALQRLPGEVIAVKTAAGKFVDATKCG